MILNGVAASGLGKAKQFTELAWVQAELVQKLDIRPYPGTFNVRLTEVDQLDNWATLRQTPGIPIEEPDGTNCAAVCYPVLVNEAVRGAILIPGVPGYPSDQVEIVAPDSIRRELRVMDGDPITLRVLGEDASAI